MTARDARECSVEGCVRPPCAHGLCNSHYKRVRRTGATGGAIPPVTPRGAAHRFYQEALKHEGNTCLLWPFNRARNGYALLCNKRSGASPLVHRLICEAQHGQPPSGAHQAAHSCGNGHLGCISRHHLSWKTPAENCADRVSTGERNANAKLTESQVAEIRALKGIFLQREIAAFFGVAQTTVSDILAGRKWREARSLTGGRT